MGTYAPCNEAHEVSALQQYDAPGAIESPEVVRQLAPSSLDKVQFSAPHCLLMYTHGRKTPLYVQNPANEYQLTELCRRVLKRAFKPLLPG